MNGNFQFNDVPYGQRTLEAKGLFGNTEKLRTGSASVTVVAEFTGVEISTH